MEVNILPANLITVTLRKSKKGSNYIGNVSIPPHILKRHDLQNKEKIVIAYICKENEDFNNN